MINNFLSPKKSINLYFALLLSHPVIPAKILIIDDHPLIQKGITLLVKSEWPAINVLTARTFVEGIDTYREQRPDVCLIDYRLNGTSGIDLAKMIFQLDSRARLIMLTMFDSIPVALNFLRLGGKGFLTKDSEVDEIIRCIVAVHKGDFYFHSQHKTDLEKWTKEGFNNSVPQLVFTNRELEVCLKISKGKTTQEIAKELNISTRTVETYRQRLIEKAGVKNAPELIEYVYRNGIQ